ncbi:MAG: winged helix-turn-helix domain-containing protein [Cyclobacteriaceae bacterium]|nr:winged helix-turn-helix domain-containing protein [Cyclobacteriaceae bacterium]
MKLHDAISQVLMEHKGPMTTSEIADALNKNGLYVKKDGSPITAFQIHGRTRNYPHLFDRDGSLVSLKSNTRIEKVKHQINRKARINTLGADQTLLVKDLMNDKNFRPAGSIDSLVPDDPGLYCIRISNPQVFNPTFAKVLEERNHNIVYIGMATQNLSKRFLGQELRAIGHGTFFRSLGAVLGYRPEPGSLKNKKNQNNYTFSETDKKKIITWINQNLLVNWVAVEGNLSAIEDKLIKVYLPLLNISKNPGALKELIELRGDCKRIARG